MTAHIAKSNLAFELPRQTYINVRLEEPNLYADETPAAKLGLFARIAQRIAAFRSWSEMRAQAAELHGMTDRELNDIGINRGDIRRVVASYDKDQQAARLLLG